MRTRIALLPLFMLSTVGFLGCTSPEEDSCNIKTAGIYVEYEVVHQGNSAKAKATFWVGDKPGGTFLTLGSCGDGITVNGQAMSKNTSDIDHDYYEANLSQTDSYTFVFTREDEDPYSSTVSPPPAVNVTGPSGGDIPRTEAFDVTWEAGSGNIKLLIDGDCIKDYPSVLGDDVPDNGSHAVAAGAIEPFVSSDADKSCTATVELTRSNGGSLSPSLKGTIKAESVGTTSFTSTP